jgi:hypothetical protein
LFPRFCLSVPRFFFNIRDGVDVPDEEGSMLDDVGAARQEAVESAREIMAEEVKHRGKLPLADEIEIFDECGASVTKVAFEDAVEIKRK